MRTTAKAELETNTVAAGTSATRGSVDARLAVEKRANTRLWPDADIQVQGSAPSPRQS